jgi:hypothetical protein
MLLSTPQARVVPVDPHATQAACVVPGRKPASPQTLVNPGCQHSATQADTRLQQPYKESRPLWKRRHTTASGEEGAVVLLDRRKLHGIDDLFVGQQPLAQPIHVDVLHWRIGVDRLAGGSGCGLTEHHEYRLHAD